MRRRRGGLLAVLTAVLLALVGVPARGAVSTAPDAPAGTWVRQILEDLHAPDGTVRVYYLREPVGWGPGPKTAVVLLHGLGLGGLTQAKAQGWDALADRKGIVLVAGQGWKGSWSAGGCCGAAAGVGTARPHARVNDVGYVNAVIADSRIASAERGSPIVTHGTAVVGFSNGGMLAADWACTRGDDVVAVSVAGPLLVSTCAHVVHLLHVHGLEDTSVPVGGGMSSLTRTVVPDSRDEHDKMRKGSHYSLVLINSGHRWGPPGGADALTASVSAWIDHQRNGSARAGA